MIRTGFALLRADHRHSPAPPGWIAGTSRAGRDRIAEEPGEPRPGLAVEGGREPRVRDVHFAEPLVHLRRARIEPALDVPAVILDRGLHRGIGHCSALLHELAQPGVDLLALVADRLPLRLAVLLGPPRGLLVRLGVAPALSCLGLVV